MYKTTPKYCLFIDFIVGILTFKLLYESVFNVLHKQIM